MDSILSTGCTLFTNNTGATLATGANWATEATGAVLAIGTSLEQKYLEKYVRGLIIIAKQYSSLNM